MAEKSWKWIQEHREELEEKYDGKIIIVSGEQIVKMLDEPVNIAEINEIAEQICGSEDWSYTWISKEKAWLI